MPETRPSSKGTWQRLSRAFHYLRPGPGVVLIVVVHLVFFAVLYAALLRMMEQEIVYAHGTHLRNIAEGMVGALHPALEKRDASEIASAVAEARDRNGLLYLDVTDNFGRSRTDPSREVISLVSAHVQENVGIVDLEARRIGSRWTLKSTIQIRATSHCGSCHEQGARLGHVVLRRDMTEEIRVPRERLRRNTGFVVLLWLFLLGGVNVVSRVIAKRRFRAFSEGLDRGGTGEPLEIDGIFPGAMGRVSAEMYESLFAALRQVCEREERVTARIQHTERLASLGQIAAGLAHEIKNPLAGIRGALELIRDEEKETRGGRYELYGQMIGEMDRVHEILHSLLRFARPSPPHRVQADVGHLVQECVGLMAHGLRRKGIVLEAEVAPNLDSYPLDVSQIRQVLVNLVNNAGEAIRKDGSVTIRASSFPHGHGLILNVEDDGPGMTEEQISKIFQPFFTTKFSGTGLGLAVSRSIVLGHGGTLEVRSSPGEGSSFFVLLPEEVDDPL